MKKIYFLLLVIVSVVAFSCSSDSQDGTASVGDGQGGSTAIFALKGNYLYCVDHQNLNVFSLLDEAQPVKVNSVAVGFDIETLFADDTYLYIGSRSGMYIYKLEDPENPQMLSAAMHFTACDPVVAANGYAYVTLHSTSFCGNETNALMVYNIAEPSNPVLVNTRNLEQPKGLAVYGDYLLVCDEGNILLFDIHEPNLPFLKGMIPQNCNDLIVRDNTLFAVGDTGVYRYTLNQSDITNVTLNSSVDFSGI